MIKQYARDRTRNTVPETGKSSRRPGALTQIALQPKLRVVITLFYLVLTSKEANLNLK